MICHGCGSRRHRHAPVLAFRSGRWWWTATLAALLLHAHIPVPLLFAFAVGASYLAAAWMRAYLAFTWLETQ